MVDVMVYRVNCRIRGRCNVRLRLDGNLGKVMPMVRVWMRLLHPQCCWKASGTLIMQKVLTGMSCRHRSSMTSLP